MNAAGLHEPLEADSPRGAFDSAVRLRLLTSRLTWSSIPSPSPTPLCPTLTHRRPERIHRLDVLFSRPEDLAARSTLEELALFGSHLWRHAAAHLLRPERAPRPRVADAAARLAILDRTREPEDLEHLGELRVGRGGEQLVAHPGGRRALRGAGDDEAALDGRLGGR